MQLCYIHCAAVHFIRLLFYADTVYTVVHSLKKKKKIRLLSILHSDDHLMCYTA